MARATMPKGPEPHPTKWTLVFTTKLRRFNTLQEAETELEKALLRGDRAYILPPRAEWVRKRRVFAGRGRTKGT
jgi:hypothetical protein